MVNWIQAVTAIKICQTYAIGVYRWFMLITVAETPLYASQASKLLTEREKIDVINLISQNPKAGDVIPGSGGLRKLRIALEGRGKRGGGRVIYWFHSAGYPAVLLWVLAKNAASDLM
jgi:hypothetical protein